jgi:hypothetical protein
LQDNEWAIEKAPFDLNALEKSTFQKQERICRDWLESGFCGVPVMRKSNWTPSIVPHDDDDQDVYIVMDDFAGRGSAWREADVGATDLGTVIADLVSGQYNDPIRVVAFNIAEGWSRDVSAEVAHELRQRCDLQLRDVPFFLQDFVDRYEGRYRDIQLPLPMRLV